MFLQNKTRITDQRQQGAFINVQIFLFVREGFVQTFTPPFFVRGSFVRTFTPPFFVRGSFVRTFTTSFFVRGSFVRTYTTPFFSRAMYGRTRPYFFTGQCTDVHDPCFLPGNVQTYTTPFFSRAMYERTRPLLFIRRCTEVQMLDPTLDISIKTIEKQKTRVLSEYCNELNYYLIIRILSLSLNF